MNKIKKILIGVIITAFILSFDSCVNASVNDTKLVVKDIDGVFAVQKYKTGGSRMYLAQIYEMHKNGEVYIGYCIELGAKLNATTYSSTYDYSKFNISSEDAEYLKLVAYYGYKYSNHNDYKYYLAAQELMWERLGDDEVYWTSEEDFNGKTIDVEYEKSKILDYVNKHNLKPSFTVSTINYGEKIVLEDKNKVLGFYDIKVSNGGMSTHAGKIIIETNNFGDVTISMKRRINNDNKEMFYYAPGSQNIISVGVINDGEASYTLKNKGVKIKINKKDYETKENILKEGFYFKLYDMTNNKYVCLDDVCEFRTNKDGVAILPNVPIGNYKIEEVDKGLDGYLYNSSAVEFRVDNESVIDDIDYGKVVSVDFYNKKPTGKIIINKSGEKFIYQDNNLSYEDIPLIGVKFNVITKQDIFYNGKLIKKGQVVAQITTDENGVAIIDNLGLGEYEIQEVSTLDNYILDDSKYVINLEYKDQYTDVIEGKLNIKNELKKGKLYFKKISSDTNLGLEGVTIAIYNQDNKKIYEAKTDKNGNIYLDNLAYGTYYIKELSTLDNYVLSNDVLSFTIDDDNREVKLTMKNDKLEMPPKTFNKNYSTILIIMLLIVSFCLIRNKSMI